jgi:hypothetical protein
MITTRVGALFVILTISFAAGAARAQDVGAPTSNVRGTDDATALLIRDLVARSATGRELVDALDRSDLVVYVRRRVFPSPMLNGRIGFVRSRYRRRLVAIEIASPRNYADELAALGHELQHAVEIAAAPAVCDAASLSALYSRIGDVVTLWTGSDESYETRAAADAGRRVRREIFQTAAHEN